MEKKSFKDFVTHIKESLQGGLETARSEGIPKKIAAIVFGMIALSLVFVLLLRALDVLFNAISQFVNQHFPSIAAATAGGSFLFMRHNERKEAQRKAMQKQQSESDVQRQRFAKGCYKRIGNFIYSQICTMPNFPDLTSLNRPLRPEDMGNERMDAYVINGIIYLRYALPKSVSEQLDTKLISSVIQGLCDQKIRTGGLVPFMSAGENDHLFVEKVEDMATYVALTLVLDFDQTYVQQLAYQQAMNDLLSREKADMTLKDSDYDE